MSAHRARAPSPPLLPPHQDLDASEHQFTRPPCEEGLEALRLLQGAVFGADSLECSSFAECVFLASLAQVRQRDARACCSHAVGS